MHPVSHVFDPMFVRLKMTLKLSGALRFHGHITTGHSTMEVRHLLVLCTAHDALVGRMEIQQAAMQQLRLLYFLGVLWPPTFSLSSRNPITQKRS